MGYHQDIFRNQVHFTSLGCPRNRVDSEVMLGILLKNGYELSCEVQDADYLIVNSCGFLQAAREEAKEVIRELFLQKKPSAKIIVTGCMVNQHKDSILGEFPEIHYLLGSGDVHGIMQAIQSDQPGVQVGKAKSFLEAGEIPRMVSTGNFYAYIKIAEGCKKSCAFCSIPKIKGPLKSKPIERVLHELRILLDQGIYEIILIAQDLGDYGKDLEKRSLLATLLREMLKETRPFWLRLLYIYPDEIDDELIEIMKSDKRICSYVDMPIQHISDDILKKMGRKTNRAEILAILQKLRQEIPEIQIRTSLMVGFPSETEEQFQELLAFVKSAELNQVGFFAYSREKESRSYDFSDQIEESVKQRRLEEIRGVQYQVIEKINQKFLGQKLEVVIEGYHPESKLLMVGRTRGQAPEIDGQVIINDVRKVTDFAALYEVEITQVAGFDLVGRVIKSKKNGRLPLSKQKKMDVIIGG